MSSHQQLTPLTGLRFILSLWVVMFHQNRFLHVASPSLSGLLRTGYVAVGFFFVLSGFVLAYNYPSVNIRSRKELARFGVARLARIYPIYILGFIIASPIVLFGSQGLLRRFSAVTLSSTCVTALLNISLMQAWVPKLATRWNVPGWSLSDEAFFYMCFPFIIVLASRLLKKRTILLAGLVIWMLAILAPVATLTMPVFGLRGVTADVAVQDAAGPNLIKFMPILRLPEFCMGVVIARFYSVIRRSTPSLVGHGSRLYVPALSILIIVLCNADKLPYALVHNGLLLPLYAISILGFALGGGLIARMLATRPLVFLGGASYAVYILHGPLETWYLKIIREVTGSDSLTPVLLVIYVFATQLLCCFVYKWMEEPAAQHFRHWLMLRCNLLPEVRNLALEPKNKSLQLQL